jgi:hypothetical protein
LHAAQLLQTRPAGSHGAIAKIVSHRRIDDELQRRIVIGLKLAYSKRSEPILGWFNSFWPATPLRMSWASHHIANSGHPCRLKLDNFEVAEFGLDDVDQAVAHAAANGGPFKMTVIRP